MSIKNKLGLIEKTQHDTPKCIDRIYFTEINFNKVDETVQTGAKFATGDINTNILIFQLKLYENFIDLSNGRIRVYANILKPDNTRVVMDCVITEATEGVVSIELPQQAIILEGEHFIEIVVQKENMEKLISPRASYRTFASIEGKYDIEESESSYPIISKMIEDIDVLKENKIDRVELVGRALKFYADGNEKISIILPATGDGGVVGTGEDGATFIPSVSPDGIISWTNDKNLPNPPEVNIKGANGSKGDTGATPNISIGTITTLEPNEQASVRRRGTNENPVFDFDIPRGRDGQAGSIDSSDYQTKVDENLTTINKTIVGAINELNSKISQQPPQKKAICGEFLCGELLCGEGLSSASYFNEESYIDNINQNIVYNDKLSTELTLPNWINNETPINAENLNKINNEINRLILDIKELKQNSNLVIRDIVDGEIFDIGEYVPPVITHVQSVSIDKSDLTISVNGTHKLSIAILPENASDKSVNWSSSNDEVATVVNGNVTGVSEGNCTITVSTNDGSKTDTCNVLVEAGESEVIEFTNLLYKSGTFEQPAGHSTYWQGYKCTKEILANGSVKYTHDGGESGGIVKCQIEGYHNSTGEIIEGHKYYIKHKKSENGATYNLYSNIYIATQTGLPLPCRVYNYTGITNGQSIWIKDCLMIDLSEIYGVGNEPTQLECDSIYGDLWKE